MKTIRLILAHLLMALMCYSTVSRAEDIDIYSGLGTTSNVPNVLFVVDNSANFEASSGGVICTQQADGSLVINGSGTPTDMSGTGSGTVGGIEQCALWNVVKSLPVNADSTARVNIGFMMYNGNNITDVAGLNCGGSLGGCLTQPMIAMTAANKSGVLNWIASWNTSPSAASGNVKAADKATAATMQEAWAYYTGGTGLSGRSYAGVGNHPSSGCQKNFIIYIANSFAASAGPGDASSGGPLNALTAAINGQTQPDGLTDSEWAAKKSAWNAPILNTVATACSATPYNFASPSSNHSENGGDYADEWARFMQQSDIYDEPIGTQSITTYTVGLLDPAKCKPEYPALLSNMAVYGGGKYFATTSYDTIVNAILKILNEVQAVNSVFSSSSLPVSVNAQGTYLNQIYMGMFRPDSGALPRWAGNLKQYQFMIDSATGGLNLGDSVGNLALDSSGTGFLSPNAISFWTCTDTALNSYPSTRLTAAQQALLVANNQTNVSSSCVDPANGFWVNSPSSAKAAALGFDLPDGELVERGGAAQQLRHASLSVDYTASPAAPRKLYTFCPTGASCNEDLTNAANVFATSNAALTAGMFGSSSSVNVSTLSRSATTATVATSGNHGFTTGESIAIANATPSNYNGTFTITKIDNTHFTYPVIEYPPTTATGSYTASLPSAPQAVTLARSGNTVTATSLAHGYIDGQTVTISGANQSAYNGNFAIGGVTDNAFTFTVTETPTTVASGGTATGEKQATGGCPSPCMVSFAIASVTRSGTTVTVNTTDNHNFLSSVGKVINLSGVVDGSGNPVAEYSGNITTTSWNNPTNNRSFTFTTAVSPATPATIAAGYTSITASTPSAVRVITSLTRSGSTVTVVAAGHGYTTDDSVSIGGTPGANEEAYVGTHTITVVDANTFTYAIVTAPASPASGAGGATMTATRSTGFLSGDRDNLINWVRGEDNYGDESGPGGTVNVRPSIHGDVLHSRPTVINYGSHSVSIESTSDSGATRTATASEASDIAVIAGAGPQPIVTFANKQACPVTVASATTFTYPTTNCGESGAQTVSVGSKVVVFYGDNGGVFHAVNGNQTALFGSAGPGDEMWGFIPSEFFLKLNRLRTNSPQLNLPSTPPGISPDPAKKDYFIDGTTGFYQLLDGSGNTLAAHLYLTMRRGGRLIYALDVTDPAVPKVLWKIDPAGLTTPSGFTASADFAELGQTWSQPKVARIKGYCGGLSCAGNPQTPVLIFGAGYDTNEDVEPPSADVMGRGIFVVDAITGALIWKATYSAGSTAYTGNTIKASAAVSGMNYSIPADLTIMDRDADGFIDRLYAADTGGNIWRVDLEPGNNSTPDNWRVYKLAALGCGSGPCSAGSTPRKFFYPPEVINTLSYDAVIAGSGDREHPLYVDLAADKTNRVYLLKDTFTGDNASGMTTVDQGDLFDATSASWNGTLSGYMIELDEGEKVVNAPLVTAGFVYFGTNQPTEPSANSCTSNLGVAKGYQLQPFTGSYDSVVFAGGGLPPSPVSGVVNIATATGIKLVPFLIGGGNPDCVGSDCTSALGGQKPVISVPTSRTRTYWYQEID
jgi:type IV pilus assembly protein PilY1